ncbi:MAG: hypothetical protein HPY83_12565 [Anaerolineae bacterium]|nr:hypothetical protein [Anaerolineae bacterium]
MSERRRYLGLALILAVFAAWPLLAPGYFLGAHDGPHTLFFLVQFDRAVADGVLIPRWGPDHALGYGYPTFVFYSPLAYYVAEGFHLTGLGIAAAIKAAFALSILVSCVGMFLLAEALLRQAPTDSRGFGAAAAVAAVVYTYAPYRFVDIYVRAALAESWALSLFPWALWAFWSLATAPSRRRIAAAAATYGLLLAAHNVTALLFTPLLGAAIIIALAASGRLPSARAWLGPIAAGALGVALAAFSLIPSLAERGYIRQEQWTRATYNLTDHFVYPGQLLSPLWDYGYAVAGPEDTMPFQQGLAPVALSLAGLALGTRSRCFRPAAVLLGLGLVTYTFLMTGASGAIWRAVSLLSLAQFPWRLLGIVALCAAGLAAIAGARLADRAGQGSALLLALAVVVASLPYARPQHTAPDPRAEQPVGTVEFELEYTDMRGMTAWTQHMPQDSPKVAAYLAGEALPLAETDAPGASVEPLHLGGHVQIVRVRSETAGELRFHTYYYPGWRAYVDGVPAPVRPAGPLGVIALDLPAGEHRVTIHFGETPLRLASDWVSLAAVMGIAVLGLSPGRDHTSRNPHGNH